MGYTKKEYENMNFFHGDQKENYVCRKENKGFHEGYPDREVPD